MHGSGLHGLRSGHVYLLSCVQPCHHSFGEQLCTMQGTNNARGDVTLISAEPSPAAVCQVRNNTLRFVRRLKHKGFPHCKGNGVPNADWHPECSNIWNERVVHVRGF